MSDAVHTYGSESLELILSLLQPTLPYSLPLYRRLQLSKNSKLDGIFATFSLEHVPNILPAHFAIGILDLDSPGVNAWVFSSFELQCGIGSATNSVCSEEHDEHQTIAVKQLIQIFSSFRKYSSSLNGDASPRHNILLTGSVRSEITDLLRSVPGLVLESENHGPFGPYGKYIFRLADVAFASEPAIPKGLYFDRQIRRTDHELIISNNAIVKSSESLLYLPYGLGIRSEENDTLIAWVFMGVDGCLRTLYVLPEYRRLGLAHVLAAKAAKDSLEIFTGGSQDMDDFVYGDVGNTNTPSVKVFQSLGACWAWDSYWIEVDLDKAISTA